MQNFETKLFADTENLTIIKLAGRDAHSTFPGRQASVPAKKGNIQAMTVKKQNEAKTTNLDEI